MYVCGPTVYSFPHRQCPPAVVFDVLAGCCAPLPAHLRRNITDIDDKINGAAEQGFHRRHWRFTRYREDMAHWVSSRRT
jgi:cysteinyl-tRNA synthetase